MVLLFLFVGKLPVCKPIRFGFKSKPLVDSCVCVCFFSGDPEASNTGREAGSCVAALVAELGLPGSLAEVKVARSELEERLATT